MSTKKIQIIGKLGSNIEIDKTLSKEDYAADAKAVGDALEAANTHNVIIDIVIDAICNGTIAVLNESKLNYAIIA